MARFSSPILSLTILALQLLCVSAQESPLQTLYRGRDFGGLAQCAQNCFTRYVACYTDILGLWLQCSTPPNACMTAFGVSDTCYCRQDKQPQALSILSDCITDICTVGNPTVDISSAQSIYTAYCNAKRPAQNGPPAVSATTTLTAETGQISSSSPTPTISVPSSSQAAYSDAIISPSSTPTSQTANSVASISPPSILTSPSPTGESSSSSTNTIAIAVAASLGSLLLIAAVIAFGLWRRRSLSRLSQSQTSQSKIFYPPMHSFEPGEVGSEISPYDSASSIDGRSAPGGNPTLLSG